MGKVRIPGNGLYTLDVGSSRSRIFQLLLNFFRSVHSNFQAVLRRDVIVSMLLRKIEGEGSRWRQDLRHPKELGKIGNKGSR